MMIDYIFIHINLRNNAGERKSKTLSLFHFQM